MCVRPQYIYVCASVRGVVAKEAPEPIACPHYCTALWSPIYLGGERRGGVDPSIIERMRSRAVVCARASLRPRLRELASRGRHLVVA